MKKSYMFAMAALLVFLFSSAVNAQTTANVTFQVDMRAEITGGTFDPAGTDFLEVAGSFNEWQNPPADTLKDADGDSIYTGTFELSGTVGSTVHNFKFLQRTANGDVWEGDVGVGASDRALPHPDADTTLIVVKFNQRYPNTVMVTFQLDMSIQIRKSSFDPAADQVEIAGSFNEWQNDPAAFLEDSDGDSVYTGTWELSGTVGETKHFFKYLQRKASGDVWEGLANDRTLDHPATATVVDPVFWNDDPGLVENAVMVTFQVDMRVKMQEPEVGDTYVFNPAIDIVEVAGTFNEWQNLPADTLRDADGDSIYTGTFELGGSVGFTTHLYKFLIRSPGGDVWEDNVVDNSGGNRYLAHPTSDTTLPAVYYDDDEIVSLPATGNILFQVDAAVLEDIGVFRRAAGDVMWTLGSFTDWQGALDDPAREYVMTRVPPSEIHQLLVSYSGLTGDQLPYKFYIEFVDSAYMANNFTRHFIPGMGWEEPASRGGGDRRHEFISGNQVGRQGFWSDFPAAGLIPEGDTVTVNMSVDMNPAMGSGGTFDPATDNVYFHNRSPLFSILRDSPWQAPDSTLQYDDSDGDGIYNLTFDLVGPAPYLFQYAIQGGATSDDHGLSTTGRHRTRYIQPVNGQENTFPRTFTFPMDTWNPSPGPDHVNEEPPFSATTLVEEVEGADIPDGFALYDNYPNPFNPSTTIEFDISSPGLVEIAVFNIVGQKIRTLTDKQFSQAGRYKVEWNGRDGLGRLVGSGVYFYRLKAGDVVKTKKMIMVK
ncbi:MAG: T9SS type A sorting domain-containing protein [Deferribacteres bacterium]|nr:T9SS type A sorting domain-containing protein [Deferribacteres bacterium]